MLKRGIYKKEQLSLPTLSSSWNKRKFLALDLYDDLDDRPKEERDAIQERMLVRFSVSNRTFKYTYANRFEAFEDKAAELILESFPKNEKITVHDVGASDGRTTHGFYKKLNDKYGTNVDYLASDYAPYFYVVRRKGSKRRVIVDENNKPLQIIFPPFVFNLVLPEHKIFYPLNHIARKLITKLYAEPLLSDANIQRDQLALICKECRDYMESANNFKFEVFDLFSTPKREFHVVRVMNLLNERYFPKEELESAVKNIHLSTKEGGILITGSNMEQGTTIDGGIYQKTSTGFKNIHSSGVGSLVNEMILKMR